jgi:hypothetical protein
MATNGNARVISDDERTPLLSNTPCHGRGESLVKSLPEWFTLQGRVEVASV